MLLVRELTIFISLYSRLPRIVITVTWLKGPDDCPSQSNWSREILKCDEYIVLIQIAIFVHDSE